MRSVRVLADDLTGALDAGACFVGTFGELAVGWRDSFEPGAESFVIDNETREEPEAGIAAARTHRDLRRLSGAGCAFKKIDTLIRGHTVAELEACVSSDGFASVVVAPAFPQQGRITRDGQQFAKLDGWKPVGPDLIEALRSRRPVRRVGSNETPQGSGAFVCDGETDAAMRTLPARLRDVEHPILWCGSAGLARALAPKPATRRDLPSGSALVIVGSDHPVAQLQCAALADTMPDAFRPLKPKQDVADLIGFLSDRILAGKTAIIAAEFGDIDRASARSRLGTMLHDILPRLPAPDALIVTGGDTLRFALDAVAATHAIVDGEVSPGIAQGRAVGGDWDGVSFVSKSGAFGSPSVLTDVLALRSESALS